MIPPFLQTHLAACLFAINMVSVALMLAWTVQHRNSKRLTGSRLSIRAILSIGSVLIIYTAVSAFLIGAMAVKV